jgi:hypothetical protein
VPHRCAATPDQGGDANARDAREWIEQASRGDFAAAWEISDRIRARHAGRRDWTVPRHYQRVWDGTPFDDRRVLIRCYHGLGDTIQFIRYAPLVRARARAVAVWAQPSLLPLLQSLDGVDQFLPLHDGDPGVEYDVDVEVMELPYAFRTTLATIPIQVPYLHANPAPLAGEGLRAGVVWRAGDWDVRRSVPFADLAPLFDCDHVTWFSLQREEGDGRERHDRLHLLDANTPLGTAAAMRGLDLVVTVDTMLAHLAGALAVPVWTLLPHDADWRWMRDRADSPWYPTMRLFRQSTAGAWRPVIDDLITCLTASSGTPRDQISAGR